MMRLQTETWSDRVSSDLPEPRSLHGRRWRRSLPSLPAEGNASPLRCGHILNLDHRTPSTSATVLSGLLCVAASIAYGGYFFGTDDHLGLLPMLRAMTEPGLPGS